MNDSKIECRSFPSREPFEIRGCRRQSGLLLVVVRGQYAQGRERNIRVRPPAPAPVSADAPLDQVTQSLRESIEPLIPLAKECMDLAVGNLTAGLEEAVAFMQERCSLARRQMLDVEVQARRLPGSVYILGGHTLGCCLFFTSLRIPSNSDARIVRSAPPARRR